jgi:hypothetical protein
MSSLVLPAYKGLVFPIKRTTSYKSLTDTSVANQVTNLALQQYPVHSYDLQYELLRDDVTPSEYRAIQGTFNACAGRFDSFLYLDPVFNTVTAEQFGVGDGTTKNFQIVAKFQNTGGPGGPDIIQNFNGAPSFFDNGSPAGSSVLGPTGILTFATAPVAGHVLTWSGSFYQRCHFTVDTLDAQQFLKGWWQIDSIPFISVVL